MSTAQAIQQLVDAMIERCRAEHPGVEFSIFVSPPDSLLLPKDGDKLWRGAGYFTGHVYRDCMVEPLGGDDVVALVALDAAAPTYYGMLRTGEVTTTSPYGPAADSPPDQHEES